MIFPYNRTWNTAHLQTWSPLVKRENWKCPHIWGDHTLNILKEPKFNTQSVFPSYYEAKLCIKIQCTMFTAKDYIKWFYTIILHIQKTQVPVPTDRDSRKKYIFSIHSVHLWSSFYIYFPKWNKQTILCNFFNLPHANTNKPCVSNACLSKHALALFIYLLYYNAYAMNCK